MINDIFDSDNVDTLETSIFDGQLCNKYVYCWAAM